MGKVCGDAKVTRGYGGDTRGETPGSETVRGYALRGVPVKLHNAKWTKDKVEAAIKRGPHQSTELYSAA